MVIEILLFILGILLLYKGSDWLVNSASRIAKHLGVSPFVIGISLVALGTSIPEVSTAITSAVKNETTLITGNLLGSNITTITLIFGLILLLGKVKPKKQIVKREAGIMVFTAILFLVLGITGTITRIKGILLLLLYLAYLGYVLTSKQHKKHYGLNGFINYILRFEYLEDLHRLTEKKKKRPRKKKESTVRLKKEIVLIIIGLAAVIIGARLLIQGAIFFADILGVSTGIIGLTIVALGTSSPEISVALRSIKKGLANLTIGDIIGSNITNILFIMGIASMIRPIEVFKESIILAGPLLIILSLFMYHTLKTEKQIPAWKGALLIIIYIAYLFTSLFLGLQAL